MQTSTIYAEELNPGDTIKITDELWQNSICLVEEPPFTAKVLAYKEAPDWVFIHLDFMGAVLILDYDQTVQIVTERLAP